MSPFAGAQREMPRTLAVGTVSTTTLEKAQAGRILVRKRLLPRFARDPVAIAMLAREAAILGKLAGSSAPALSLAGEDEHGRFVLMDWVDAPTLMEARGIGTETVRAAFAALATVHEAADAAGPLAIVHGDLSPSNVLVGEGRATVIDFSLASWRDDPRLPGGPFRGTIAYAAPEAARGEALGPRADLFALAASLLHVASGETPRSGTSHAALLLEAGELPLREYASRAGGRLPKGTAELLARCVAFREVDRPASAQEIASGL